MVASDDLMREQAYLVERGVRALAIVGTCLESEADAVPALLALAGAYSPGAVLWVVAREDGMCDYGYAASGWAADLYRWAWSPNVPTVQRERIIGLLLGYAPEAVERFEARLPHLRVMDGPVAVGARRELVASGVDRDGPLWPAIRGVGASLRRLVSGVRHG